MILGLQVYLFSLLTGPDLESCSSESSRSQMNQSPSTNNQLSIQDTAWGQEEEVASENDDPLVQLDEEDVQLDLSLVGLRDVSTMRGSDESDSTGDVPSG